MLSNIVEYARISLSCNNTKVNTIKNIFHWTDYEIIGVFVQQIRTIFIMKYNRINLINNIV